MLDSMATDLKSCGANGVNISIDSTDGELYKFLTGGHELTPVIKSINTAIKAGLKVKLNTVLIRKYWQDQVVQLYELAKQYNVPLRFIELMPIGEGVKNEGLSSDEVVPYLIRKFGDPILSSTKGNGPAHYMNIGGVDIGFIDALSHSFCNKCNRLRMLSNGEIKLCLYQKPSINIKDLLDKEDDEIARIFNKIIKEKKKHHNMNEKAMELTMASIGG
jgi:cyclic pyranopterin phosphate synthase